MLFMQQVQFIGITPEQLQNAIIEGVKTQLNNFKEHFEPKTPTEYLTRKETATLLSINLSTLHLWTKAKKLKAYGKGKRVYYKRSEVESSIIRINE